VSIEKQISELVSSKVRSLNAYKVPESTGLIKLDAMENPWEWSGEIEERWKQKLSGAQINRYPSADSASLKLALRNLMGIGDDFDIILGNGSDEIIQLLVMLIAHSNRPVLSIEPSFVMYKMLSIWLNVEYVGVPLNSDFSLDTNVILTSIKEHNPAVTFIAQPNNPTGNLFEVNAIREIAQATSGLVVVDEAYIAFSDSDSLHLLDEFSNILLMRTLSKVGLAGLRLGVLIGGQQWLREINKIRLPYNINVLTQISAEFAIDNYHVFEAQTKILRENRATLYSQLVSLEGVDVWPSSANFLLIRVLNKDVVSTHQALKDRGVLVKMLHGSHELLENCLRVNVSTKEENEQLVVALKSVLT